MQVAKLPLWFCFCRRAMSRNPLFKTNTIVRKIVVTKWPFLIGTVVLHDLSGPEEVKVAICVEVQSEISTQDQLEVVILK